MVRRRFLQLLGLGGVAALSGFGAKQVMAANRYYDGPVSDHFDGTRFFNPQGEMPGNALDLLRWKFGEDSAVWPDAVRNEAGQAVPDERVEDLRVTMVGHATMLVQTGGLNILTDPVWSERVSPVSFAGPKRVRAPGIAFESLPPIDLVLLSHNHYDHMDEWTVKALPKSIQWFVPKGLGKWFHERGCRVKEMDWWQKTRRGKWKITCLPAQHWSNRFWMSRNGSLWCAWLVESNRRKYFFGGDSGYFHGFAEIGKKFAPIDVAMLPIGAYEPRWFMRYAHMNPPEAYRAFKELRARWMVPMHWGTFDLTDEPVDVAPAALSRFISKSGDSMAQVRLMAVGERWQLS